ncbi:hypothetical protein [Lacticaseibacillus zhaodongensis]|uniref:hypothetical protein n=1 Tax=Lacticaseibacillus zhaodongensis TaxID=2668065 RepID=UPI0012D2B5EB|nr:hypothetical protein [Lacticaseibacillus zhaodongensis]
MNGLTIGNMNNKFGINDGLIADLPATKKEEISNEENQTWAKGVAAPIVGATKEKHLREAVAAQEVTLTPDDVAALEAPYQPYPVVGALNQNPPAGTILVDEKKSK